MMKKFVLIIAAVLFGTAMAKAATAENKVDNVNLYAGNSFIFVENGVTFSVFPDGEFDFYVDNRLNIGAGAQIGNIGVTFNSGFDYNPYVQFDDFGAVIQVENVPIFYDFYGRVNQIGSVSLNFNNGFVNRIGGMNIFYNGGNFSHFNGFINIHNRRYIYRPFHRWFARPAVGFFNVWHTPYRQFYSPIRYTWHRPYSNNIRRAYAQIGREHRYNNVRRERATIYRNDRRVAVRENATRRTSNLATRNSVTRNDRVAKRADGLRNNRTVASNSTTRATRNSSVATRSSAANRNATTTNRGNNRATSVTRSTTTTRNNRSAVRDNQGTAVTKREETRTPRSTTVSRTSTRYTKPVARSTNARSASSGTRSTSVSKAPARSSTRSSATRSSSSRRQ